MSTRFCIVVYTYGGTHYVGHAGTASDCRVVILERNAKNIPAVSGRHSLALALLGESNFWGRICWVAQQAAGGMFSRGRVARRRVARSVTQRDTRYVPCNVFRRRRKLMAHCCVFLAGGRDKMSQKASVLFSLYEQKQSSGRRKTQLQIVFARVFESSFSG